MDWDSEPGRITSENRMAQGEIVELRVDAKLDSLSLVRALTSAVAMRADYDIDAIADLKLAADEICTMLIRRAAPDTPLRGRFSLLPRSLTFEMAVRAADTAPVPQQSLSWRLLTALVDSVSADLRADSAGHPELAIEVLVTRKVADQ